MFSKRNKYLVVVFVGFILILSSAFIYFRKTAYNILEVSLDSIEGYPKQISFSQTDSLSFAIHTEKDASYQLYQLKEKLYPLTPIIKISKTIQSNVYHPKFGLDWEYNLSLKLDSIASGYFTLKIWNELDTCFVPFIIKENQSAKVAVIASTNTWHAYNEWGGKSFYYDHRSPSWMKWIYSWFPELKPIDFLPSHRPYDFANDELQNISSGVENLPDFSTYQDFEGVNVGSHLITGEWNLIHFLELNNIDYSVYSDEDFERNRGLNSAQVIIFNTHSEYWSKEMIARFDQWVSEGKSFVFASGNNMYRAVESYESGIRVLRNPEYSREEVSKRLGTYYTEMTYLKVAPYRIELPKHWIFDGVENEIIGRFGASGYETDKTGPASTGFQVLAIGENQAGPAYMVYKEFPQGNFVFNASSIMFSKGLTRDDDIQQIMRNLLSHGK